MHPTSNLTAESLRTALLLRLLAKDEANLRDLGVLLGDDPNSPNYGQHCGRLIAAALVNPWQLRVIENPRWLTFKDPQGNVTARRERERVEVCRCRRSDFADWLNRFGTPADRASAAHDWSQGMTARHRRDDKLAVFPMGPAIERKAP
jgi:hypothetical protein